MSDDLLDDGRGDEPEWVSRPLVPLPTGLLDAPALALASLVLATLSAFGTALFSGYTYLGSSDVLQRTGVADDRVGAQLLGAGLALLPLLLGLWAARGSTGLPLWVGAAARAAVVVAATSALLRLAVLGVNLSTSGPSGFRFV
jgi:hypothetical protein